MSKIEDLEKLQQLKEKGALTDEEFEKEKKIILNDVLSDNTSTKSENVRKKMKPWQIILLIILILIFIIVVRIYNICNWQWSYKQL